MPDTECSFEKPGEWVRDGRDYNCWVCPDCLSRAAQVPHGYGVYLSNFCPCCGKDMRSKSAQKNIEADWLMKYFGGMDNDECLPVEYILEVIKHAPDAADRTNKS